MEIRIGQGYDVHQLAEGREFWLGGVHIPASFGPTGHSDADVLLHALCDALLGALALGDIGVHFKNTDERWRGKASIYFLEEVVRMVKEAGYAVVNVDCSLSLEAPKVMKYAPAMRAVIAPVLGVGIDRVSVKATTSETLGFVGRGEGVWAMAIALLQKQ